MYQIACVIHVQLYSNVEMVPRDKHCELLHYRSVTKYVSCLREKKSGHEGGVGYIYGKNSGISVSQEASRVVCSRSESVVSSISSDLRPLWRV